MGQSKGKSVSMCEFQTPSFVVRQEDYGDVGDVLKYYGNKQLPEGANRTQRRILARARRARMKDQTP